MTPAPRQKKPKVQQIQVVVTQELMDELIEELTSAASDLGSTIALSMGGVPQDVFNAEEDVNIASEKLRKAVRMLLEGQSHG